MGLCLLHTRGCGQLTPTHTLRPLCRACSSDVGYWSQGSVPPRPEWAAENRAMGRPLGQVHADWHLVLSS